VHSDLRVENIFCHDQGEGVYCVKIGDISNARKAGTTITDETIEWAR
jgi:hypothetical protein